jgi:DNA repair protein RadA/Sms
VAKPQRLFACQQCGLTQPKWSGQCSGCESWNTFVEEMTSAPPGLPSAPKTGRVLSFTTLDAPLTPLLRASCGIEEFDRVCGGGLVPGSVLLVGGDPGIGKSTLLLQVAASLSLQHPCLYISGEEAVDQVRLRAQRLQVQNTPMRLASATNLNDVIATLEKERDLPALVIIDSIQTMYLEQLDSAPGSVSQVRACTSELIRLAKKRHITFILVGHVTKEGAIAGPRVLEHMVDTVLYFEGERGHHFRILRGVKNRFGATDEIGVFEMAQQGLTQVPNPSALFLSQKGENVPGSVIFAGLEGTRPVLVEIQTLVAPTSFGTPRRSVIGWDANRLSMVIAVLEARCGIQLGARDVYLSVVGGLRIQEPAADLAVAAALVSSLNNVPCPSDAVYFGEIGLSGEVRSVSQEELRLKEAQKLGFKRAFVPRRHTSTTKSRPSALSIDEISYLAEIGSSFDQERTPS